MKTNTSFEIWKDWNKVTDVKVSQCIDLMRDDSGEIHPALKKHLESDFRKWMLSREYTKNTFFDARTYYDCFDTWNIINNEDIDFLEVFIGKVGSGKSTLALQKC